MFDERYRSQQGLDRSQETVDYDVPANDAVKTRAAWLDIRPLGGKLTLRAHLEHHARRNRVDKTFAVSKAARRFSLNVGAVF